MRAVLEFMDSNRAIQLVTGVLGIYVSYLLTGVLHESMLKKPYYNSELDCEDKFTWAEGFLIFPCGLTWLIGEMVNRCQIKNEDRTYIPSLKAAKCALTVSISTLTYTYAVYLTNFPVVMMVKSCNILSVILVGVCCSQVTEHQLKLGSKKIIVAVLVTIGIVLFKVYDPESNKKDEKQTEIMGILLLLASLLADGFLPDFQAEIKSVHKPQPMEMLVAINKWSTIISIIYSICRWEFGSMLKYIFYHHKFALHMLVMGIFTSVGQMFVYRMIKQFRQHVVPFVITTRKIFTVALSIFFYGHETNFVQILGLITVFGVVTFEFATEIGQPGQQPSLLINSTSDSTFKPPLPSLRDESLVEQQSVPKEDIVRLEQQLYNQRIKKESDQVSKGRSSQQTGKGDLLDD